MYKPFGLIPAIATPMDSDGNIDSGGLRRQVRRQLGAGAHAIFTLGTNGEFYALDRDEKLEVARVVIDECAGRRPVIVGTGCVTTRESVALSREAQRLGADAVSVITPYFGVVGEEQQYAHFAAVADGVDIPVILYNIPARTGNMIKPALAARLAQVRNIVGIKDSSGDFDNIMRYIEQTPDGFSVIAGNDSLILSTLMLGGTGGISGIANILPEKMVSIYELFMSGRFEEAKKAQFLIRSIRNCLALGNPNSIVKRAMNLIGEDVGPAREPFGVTNKDVDDKILAALQKIQQS